MLLKTRIRPERLIELAGFRNDRNGYEVNGRWWSIDLEIGANRWRQRTVGIVDLSRVRDFYGKDIDGLLGQDVLASSSP